MFKLFIGTALTLLNYDQAWGGNGVVGLIPHFIGFGLILLGTRDLEKESSYFDRIQLPAYVMVVYSLVYYLIKAFGLLAKIEDWNRFAVYMIDLAEAIGILFVCYLVVFAISNMEHKKRMDIGCKRLQKFWKVMTFGFILYYISYMTNLVSENYATVAISLAMKGVEALGAVIFLFLFYRVWAKYMECTMQ